MIEEKCQLLGGSFASFIQAVLAVLCIATLIIKREQEIPRREWCVWFLDVMKQGLGAAFGHFANIYLSMIIANSLKNGSGDECQWYCLTYVGDSILGTIINILLLQIFERLVRHCPQYYFLFSNGDYGNPPQLTIWLAQLCIWLIIVILSKILLLGGLYKFLVPLDQVMTYLFAFIVTNPRFELVLVMVIIPSLLNTLQFWVTDTFLKRQPPDPADSTTTGTEHMSSSQEIQQELQDELLTSHSHSDDEETNGTNGNGTNGKSLSLQKQRLLRWKEKKRLLQQKKLSSDGHTTHDTTSGSGLGNNVSTITYWSNLTVSYAKQVYRYTGLTQLWKRVSGKADDLPSRSPGLGPGLEDSDPDAGLTLTTLGTTSSSPSGVLRLRGSDTGNNTNTVTNNTITNTITNTSIANSAPRAWTRHRLASSSSPATTTKVVRIATPPTTTIIPSDHTNNNHSHSEDDNEEEEEEEDEENSHLVKNKHKS